MRNLFITSPDHLRKGTAMVCSVAFMFRNKLTDYFYTLGYLHPHLKLQWHYWFGRVGSLMTMDYWKYQ